MIQSKAVISILIILIIGLHALPIIQRLQGERQTLWPVMAWGMYKKSRNPGPIRMVIRHITGVTSMSEKKSVDASLIGLSSYAAQRLYLNSIWAGDSSAAQNLADRLNSGRGDPFVEFRLESETRTLTEAGIATEYNPVIIYRVDR
jgi:hypothetical protein